MHAYGGAGKWPAPPESTGSENALQSFVRTVDTLNERLGRLVSWLALFMVLTQFVVVLTRYVFGLGWIWMQESIIYMHAIVFLAAAGYTLVHNGHVRVDIFYGGYGGT